MLDSNTTQWGRCSHHWSMSVVVTRTLIEISVHINEWDGSTTRKMCVQTPSLVTWVTCWLNWVIIPSIFWCHSQCLNYRQEKLLSLIYIINISSITLLRLENQQNNTSSPNLSCSSVSLMQRHSPWTSQVTSMTSLNAELARGGPCPSPMLLLWYNSCTSP